MARLKFDSEGHAFLDIKLTKRKNGFGAIICLRVPPRRGRSSLVLHEELSLGRDKQAVGDFIEALVVPSGNSRFASRDARFSFAFRMSNKGYALFEAVWRDTDGKIAFWTEVPISTVESFQRRLLSVWKAMVKAWNNGMPGKVST